MLLQLQLLTMRPDQSQGVCPKQHRGTPYNNTEKCLFSAIVLLYPFQILCRQDVFESSFASFACRRQAPLYDLH